MKLIAILSLILVAVLSCTQKPAPVASETQTSVEPAERYAIGIEYVAVPRASVHARPAEDSPVIESYGLTEAVSVLEKKDGWTLVRTFSGAGWVKGTDLVDAKTSEAMDTTTPRFYVEPGKVPFRGRGEIWLQAKVNTDGQVVEVKTVKNTTGSQAVETANIDALKVAQFYPMLEKGQHKTFVYEHRVYY